MGFLSLRAFCAEFRYVYKDFNFVGLLLAHSWTHKNGHPKLQVKVDLFPNTYVLMSVLLELGCDPNVEMFLFTETFKEFCFPTGFCFYNTSSVRMDIIELLVRFGADAGRSMELNGERQCPLLEISDVPRDRYLLEFGSSTTDAILTICERKSVSGRDGNGLGSWSHFLFHHRNETAEKVFARLCLRLRRSVYFSTFLPGVQL